MKRSRTEKSPWIKSKAKPGPKKKKIDEFHPDKRKNLAESDKGSWFNQPSESEADGASSLDVPGLGVSRKKIMAVKKGEEQNSVTGEPLPGTSQDYSSSSDSENVEEEACGETWTIVDRKELNRVLEKSVICRFCDVTATPSLSREAQVCVLSTLGALLFHWLAAFQVDTFLCEGVICV